MRRILVIVLLAFLPFQFSWSAVAKYCEHETRASGAAGHVGHHEHACQHAPDAAPAADGGAGTADGTAGAADLDCGQCHGHATGLPALSSSLLVHASTSPPGAPADSAGKGAAPDRPERPQWRRLA